MDGMIGSIAIVAALFLFVLPIFLLVRSQNLKRRANVLETENASLRDELRRIALRVRVLEQSVEALRVGAQVPKPTQVEAPPVGVSTQPNIAEPAVLASETALPAPQPKAPTLPVSPAFPRPETIRLMPVAHDVLRQTRPPETSHRTVPSPQAATNAESGAHLRKLGWAAMGVLLGYLVVHDLSPRLELWQPPNAKLGWMLLALAAALYFDGTLHRRLASQADKTDETASQVSMLVGTLFLLASAWVALPFLGVRRAKPACCRE